MENVITWFEIPANDMSRAKKFYSELLSTELADIEEGGYSMSAFPFNGQNVSGALVPSGDAKPSQNGVLVFLNVGKKLNPVLERVEKIGGKIVSGKIQIDSGVVASIIDSEGNRVGLYASE